MSKPIETINTSIYLLKSHKPKEAQSKIESFCDEIHPLIENIPDSFFFLLPFTSDIPKWLAAAHTLVPTEEKPNATSQSPSAIIWINHRGKTFALTFGHAHSRLKEEWIEPDFGKIIALSTIPQNQVQEVKAEQVFAKRHIASERAPQASSAKEFGFESDRDLVSAVEGTPEARYQNTLGEKIRGGTALKIEIQIHRILETIDLLIERHESNEHLDRWPQANNLSPVKDTDKVLILDGILNSILCSTDANLKITLAAPNEKNGEKPYPHHFVIGRISSTPATSPYLSLSSCKQYLDSKKLPMNLENSYGTTINMLDENRERIGSCSMYSCIGAEVSEDGKTYIISSGHWYLANHQFIEQTHKTLQTLSPPPYLLGTWDKKSHEGEYNETACLSDSSLWLFDKELVNFGGGTSRFEFCDIMHWPTRTLYFVKHPAGSAGVSHLCEQTRRTAEIFFSADDSYRKKLAERIQKMGKSWDTSWILSQPKRHEWNLCLALMGKDHMALPFFAKCGIARLLRELEKGGYNVCFQEV
ncbi:TIGR04141 family sporadically distributed protein [Pseudomonas sp. PS02302]|uniref:TIGR04141 family sporadically distributed protein n=1 Tax=Pseudomonas sp. PS02302 TaxID=2991428 RepID=UPI00249A2424|nr:TIGR04141 family sporadically distributed protein [Pseudomonas sp. PS02302]